MRKNNDGYVLPFVLVVMIVLTIIATSLMTAALRNLQSQQKFTERMVDKYQAEGEIEKIVAQLAQNIVSEGNKSETMDSTALHNILKTTVGSVYVNEEILEVTQADDKVTDIQKDEPFTFVVALNYANEKTTVNCELLLTAKYVSDAEPEQLYQDATFKYTISVTKLSYNSYEISTGGET